ncbi:MAG: hypothetical protein IKF72_02765 [Kiritimatiellae bacterium]|nr:hypothetical protein [Kiritimatiellia bacterium]
MKTKLVSAAAITLLAAVPLVAANVNGFENFVLSRNDYKSNPSSTIASFSSRTRLTISPALVHFNSYKPSGAIITIR